MARAYNLATPDRRAAPLSSPVASPVPCVDPVVLDLWHPVTATAEVADDGSCAHSILLGRPIRYSRADDGSIEVTEASGAPVRTHERYGYVWATFGSAEESALFDIAEVDEPDRRTLNAASIMVATSAPRAVENFLDMGHFPYVHTGLLGIEPHTEVIDYQVEVIDGEIWATECFFYQPVAAASATGGQLTEYTYRVPHPYCVLLYKSVPDDPSRRDVIALFVQAMTDTTIRAHNFLSLVDANSSETQLKRFQQIIFSQDKPVLENQRPTRLPLDPRIETPIRADRSAIVYRRWLTDLGLTYSVIPAT